MCTVEKRGNIFILTLTGDDEHRFNPTFVASLRSAIADIKSQAAASTALITTATGKFFSNGLDLHWAQSSGPGPTSFVDRLGHLVEIFKPVVADLISLPMPTIAAVSGHAAAAGFLFALSHDYFLMRKDRGVVYMSELDIGMTFPEYFSVMFREKLGSPVARREVMLRAARLKGEEALKLGIVDSVHDSGEKVVEAALGLGEELAQRKWNGEVYAEIRKGLYPESCKELGLTRTTVVAPRL